jgi:YrbI family 3-deoxy-D-manno-octulosonate 8-phosphate phosphatase
MDIRLLVCDIDGTLTDGLYTVSSNGILSKSFYTRDFYGMQLLQEAGIHVLLLTQSDDLVIRQRCDMLPIQAKARLVLVTGVQNKLDEVERRINVEYHLDWSEVAYIGDAENDLACMKVAALTACPNDAIEDVKAESNFISDYNGGKGAVYDFAKYLLKRKAENEYPEHK